MGYKVKQDDAKPKIGNPFKLTRELINKISNLVLAGNRIETAYLACGVKRKTWYEWCARGERMPRSLYGELLDKLLTADAASDIRDLQVIDKAAQAGDWKAALARLERRKPKHFALKSIVEHVGAGGGPIKTASLDSEQLDAELKRLEDALKASEE